MPNRFKQSLERLETVAEKQPPATNAPAAKPQTAAVNIGALDSLLGDIAATKRRGNTICVYLSNDVLEAIDRIMEQRGIGSRSKVINKVLRKILLVKDTQ